MQVVPFAGITDNAYTNQISYGSLNLGVIILSFWLDLENRGGEPFIMIAL